MNVENEGDRKNSKNKKKLDVSLSQSREKQKNQKSGIKLYQSDSIRKI